MVKPQVFNNNHLDPGGMGGIWVWGVEAGVGGFTSPPSAMELLVDWGVWGPCKEPDPAVEDRDASEIREDQTDKVKDFNDSASYACLWILKCMDVVGWIGTTLKSVLKD